MKIDLNMNDSEKEIYNYLLQPGIIKTKRTYKRVKYEGFSWNSLGWVVANYAPHLFDKTKFNWHDHSSFVLQYCPEHFDAELFNWKEYSVPLAMHFPQLIDSKKIDCEAIIKIYTSYLDQNQKIQAIETIKQKLIIGKL